MSEAVTDGAKQKVDDFEEERRKILSHWELLEKNNTRQPVSVTVQPRDRSVWEWKQKKKGKHSFPVNPRRYHGTSTCRSGTPILKPALLDHPPYPYRPALRPQIKHDRTSNSQPPCTVQFRQLFDYGHTKRSPVKGCMYEPRQLISSPPFMQVYPTEQQNFQPIDPPHKSPTLFDSPVHHPTPVYPDNTKMPAHQTTSSVQIYTHCKPANYEIDAELLVPSAPSSVQISASCTPNTTEVSAKLATPLYMPDKSLYAAHDGVSYSNQNEPKLDQYAASIQHREESFLSPQQHKTPALLTPPKRMIERKQNVLSEPLHRTPLNQTSEDSRKIRSASPANQLQRKNDRKSHTTGSSRSTHYPTASRLDHCSYTEASGNSPQMSPLILTQPFCHQPAEHQRYATPLTKHTESTKQLNISGFHHDSPSVGMRNGNPVHQNEHWNRGSKNNTQTGNDSNFTMIPQNADVSAFMHVPPLSIHPQKQETRSSLPRPKTLKEIRMQNQYSSGWKQPPYSPSRSTCQAPLLQTPTDAVNYAAFQKLVQAIGVSVLLQNNTPTQIPECNNNQASPPCFIADGDGGHLGSQSVLQNAPNPKYKYNHRLSQGERRSEMHTPYKGARRNLVDILSAADSTTNDDTPEKSIMRHGEHVQHHEFENENDFPRPGGQITYKDFIEDVPNKDQLNQTNEIVNSTPRKESNTQEKIQSNNLQNVKQKLFVEKIDDGNMPQQSRRQDDTLKNCHSKSYMPRNVGDCNRIGVNRGRNLSKSTVQSCNNEQCSTTSSSSIPTKKTGGGMNEKDSTIPMKKNDLAKFRIPKLSRSVKKDLQRSNVDKQPIIKNSNAVTAKRTLNLAVGVSNNATQMILQPAIAKSTTQVNQSVCTSGKMKDAALHSMGQNKPREQVSKNLTVNDKERSKSSVNVNNTLNASSVGKRYLPNMCEQRNIHGNTGSKKPDTTCMQAQDSKQNSLFVTCEKSLPHKNPDVSHSDNKSPLKSNHPNKDSNTHQAKSMPIYHTREHPLGVYDSDVAVTSCDELNVSCDGHLDSSFTDIEIVGQERNAKEKCRNEKNEENDMDGNQVHSSSTETDENVEKEFNDKNDDDYIHTFHSYCCKGGSSDESTKVLCKESGDDGNRCLLQSTSSSGRQEDQNAEQFKNQQKPSDSNSEPSQSFQILTNTSSLIKDNGNYLKTTNRDCKTTDTGEDVFIQSVAQSVACSLRFSKRLSHKDPSTKNFARRTSSGQPLPKLKELDTSKNVVTPPVNSGSVRNVFCDDICSEEKSENLISNTTVTSTTQSRSIKLPNSHKHLSVPYKSLSVSQNPSKFTLEEPEPRKFKTLTKIQNLVDPPSPVPSSQPHAPTTPFEPVAPLSMYLPSSIPYYIQGQRPTMLLPMSTPVFSVSSWNPQQGPAMHVPFGLNSQPQVGLPQYFQLGSGIGGHPSQPVAMSQGSNPVVNGEPQVVLPRKLQLGSCIGGNPATSVVAMSQGSNTVLNGQPQVVLPRELQLGSGIGGNPATSVVAMSQGSNTVLNGQPQVVLPRELQLGSGIGGNPATSVVAMSQGSNTVLNGQPQVVLPRELQLGSVSGGHPASSQMALGQGSSSVVNINQDPVDKKHYNSSGNFTKMPARSNFEKQMDKDQSQIVKMLKGEDQKQDKTSKHSGFAVANDRQGIVSSGICSYSAEQRTGRDLPLVKPVKPRSIEELKYGKTDKLSKQVLPSSDLSQENVSDVTLKINKKGGKDKQIQQNKFPGKEGSKAIGSNFMKGKRNSSAALLKLREEEAAETMCSLAHVVDKLHPTKPPQKRGNGDAQNGIKLNCKVVHTDSTEGDCCLDKELQEVEDNLAEIEEILNSSLTSQSAKPKKNVELKCDSADLHCTEKMDSLDFSYTDSAESDLGDFEESPDSWVLRNLPSAKWLSDVASGCEISPEVGKLKTNNTLVKESVDAIMKDICAAEAPDCIKSDEEWLRDEMRDSQGNGETELQENLNNVLKQIQEIASTNCIQHDVEQLLDELKNSAHFNLEIQNGLKVLVDKTDSDSSFTPPPGKILSDGNISDAIVSAETIKIISNSSNKARIANKDIKNQCKDVKKQTDKERLVSAEDSLSKNVENKTGTPKISGDNTNAKGNDGKGFQVSPEKFFGCRTKTNRSALECAPSRKRKHSITSLDSGDDCYIVYDSSSAGCQDFANSDHDEVKDISRSRSKRRKIIQLPILNSMERNFRPSTVKQKLRSGSEPLYGLYSKISPNTTKRKSPHKCAVSSSELAKQNTPATGKCKIRQRKRERRHGRPRKLVSTFSASASNRLEPRKQTIEDDSDNGEDCRRITRSQALKLKCAVNRHIPLKEKNLSTSRDQKAVDSDSAVGSVVLAKKRKRCASLSDAAVQTKEFSEDLHKQDQDNENILPKSPKFTLVVNSDSDSGHLYSIPDRMEDDSDSDTVLYSLPDRKAVRLVVSSDEEDAAEKRPKSKPVKKSCHKARSKCSKIDCPTHGHLPEEMNPDQGVKKQCVVQMKKISHEDYKFRIVPGKNQPNSKKKPKKVTFSCIYCPFQCTGSADTFTKHIKTAHKFRCFRCKESFSSKVLLERHKQGHITQLHHCVMCQKAFLFQKVYQNHLRSKEHKRLLRAQRMAIDIVYAACMVNPKQGRELAEKFCKDDESYSSLAEQTADEMSDKTKEGSAATTAASKTKRPMTVEESIKHYYYQNPELEGLLQKIEEIDATGLDGLLDEITNENADSNQSASANPKPNSANVDENTNNNNNFCFTGNGGNSEGNANNESSNVKRTSVSEWTNAEEFWQEENTEQDSNVTNSKNAEYDHNSFDCVFSTSTSVATSAQFVSPLKQGFLSHLKEGFVSPLKPGLLWQSMEVLNSEQPWQGMSDTEVFPETSNKMKVGEQALETTKEMHHENSDTRPNMLSAQSNVSCDQSDMPGDESHMVNAVTNVQPTSFVWVEEPDPRLKQMTVEEQMDAILNAIAESEGMGSVVDGMAESQTTASQAEKVNNLDPIQNQGMPSIEEGSGINATINDILQHQIISPRLEKMNTATVSEREKINPETSSQNFLPTVLDDVEMESAISTSIVEENQSTATNIEKINSEVPGQISKSSVIAKDGREAGNLLENQSMAPQTEKINSGVVTAEAAELGSLVDNKTMAPQTDTFDSSDVKQSHQQEENMPSSVDNIAETKADANHLESFNKSDQPDQKDTKSTSIDKEDDLAVSVQPLDGTVSVIEAQGNQENEITRLNAEDMKENGTATTLEIYDANIDSKAAEKGSETASINKMEKHPVQIHQVDRCLTQCENRIGDDETQLQVKSSIAGVCNIQEDDANEYTGVVQGNCGLHNGGSILDENEQGFQEKEEDVKSHDENQANDQRSKVRASVEGMYGLHNDGTFFCEDEIDQEDEEVATQMSIIAAISISPDKGDTLNQEDFPNIAYVE